VGPYPIDTRVRDKKWPPMRLTPYLPLEIEKKLGGGGLSHVLQILTYVNWGANTTPEAALR